MENVIEVKNLSKEYKKIKAINNLSFEVKKGEILRLLAPNGSGKSTRKQYIDEAISLVGLEEFRKFYPKQLSGGLLRRLNIACGIAHKPEIIILDEPTVAVAPQSRNNILEGIKKLREKGATIIYTTHYMEEVEIICDRVIILDKVKF